MHRYLLILLLGLLGTFKLCAQSEVPVIALDLDELGVNQGVSAGMVNQMVQDSSGYLWLGTSQGLNRYDGYSVKAFRHDPADSMSLGANHIKGLLIDSRGWLWVMTHFNGLYLYIRQQDAFLAIASDAYNDVKEDRFGNVWMERQNKGWFILQVDSGCVEEQALIEHPELFALHKASELYAGLPHNVKLMRALLSRQHGLWWQEADTLFGASLNRAAGQCEIRARIPVKKDTRKHNVEFGSLIEDYHSDRLVLCAGDSLYSVDPVAYTITLEHVMPHTREHLTPRLVDSRGRIWAGGDQTLHRFDPKKGQMAEIRGKGGRADGSGQLIYCHYLMEDRDNNIWFPTIGYGAFKFVAERENFGYWGDRNTGPSIARLFETNDGTIVMQDSGLVEIDPDHYARQYAVYLPDLPLGDLNPQYSWSDQDSEGNFWVKVVNFDPNLHHVLAKVNADGALEFALPDTAIVPNFKIRSLYVDRQDQVWLLSAATSLDHFDIDLGLQLCRFDEITRNTAECHQLLPHQDFPLFGYVWDYDQGSDGVIWIATEAAGLVRFDPRTGVWQHDVPDPDSESGIASHLVYCLQRDPVHPDSIMWIGTANGMNKLNIASGSFEHYSVDDGLPDRVVYSILPDKRNNLWLSTNQGLCRFNPQTLAVRNFTANDGLQHNEFNKTASVRGSDGTLYFGGVGGLTFFDPERSYQEAAASDVIITGIRLFNEPVAYAADPQKHTRGFRLDAPVGYQRTIRLKHDQSMISFEFAVMDYTVVSANRFRYQLQGYQDDWIQAGNSNVATYTNLDPGTYTFVVQGSNHKGVWSEKSDSMQVIVLPPWWATWWFRLFAALVVAGTFYAVYWFRKRKANEVRELRNQISRDLHDEIGSTLSSVALFGTVATESMDNKESTAAKMLSRINANTTRMLESMNDIVWAIKADNDRMEHVINRMRAYASEHAEASGCAIAINQTDSIRQLALNMVQRRNVYLIYKEAVNNALKYARCNRIIITLAQQGNQFTMEVADNGCGFDLAASMDQTDSLGGNGLGNMKRRAEELGGSCDLKSELNAGTTVVLSIPV